MTIDKLLIANRGEIARRIIRTCRAMGIATVAVYSEADRHAPFVQEADEAIALGGNTPGESYLRIDAILDAAQRTGSHAIHPGYGFLAENADLARGCVERGIVLVGPPADAIEAMGSKIEAKRRMQEAGVPVLPSIEVGGRSADELAKQAQQLDWPILVKASAGGGGCGMRIVRGPAELAAALEAARTEARSAFGDETVFLEPYVESPRHVEIQIFGDTHGQIVSLFERECSIQRRHQKIIEESPSVAVDDALRREMGDVAVRAGQAIGYVGAGTVEFLLTAEGKFYFLEVNTRLQVEHPVTECITGLDLVRLQILVAQGEPLPPAALNPTIDGHAIEARVYAEDPRRDYLPMTGRLQRFEFDSDAGLRVDSGFVSGSEISPYYDSLLAKVIVHAPTRAEAARRLAAALASARLHGVRTNRELLVRVLREEEFLAGQTDTHFLERHSPVELGAPLGDLEVQRIHAVAAALAASAASQTAARVLPAVPSGWRNNPSQYQQAKFAADETEILVEYQFERGELRVRVDGDDWSSVRLVDLNAECVRLEVDGCHRSYYVHRVDEIVYVDSSLGASELSVVPRFQDPEDEVRSGSLVAPFPGVVVEIKAGVGDQVAIGDTLLVIESMKMLHAVKAPAAGRVAEVRVESGGHVEMGAILAVVEPADEAT